MTDANSHPQQREWTRRWKDVFSSNSYILLVVVVAGFTDTFLYDLIIPGIPQILEGRLGIPNSQVQFWTSVLLAVFGGFFLLSPPFVGVLTDWCQSKQSPFLLGLFAMAASTVMYFLGRHIAVLIVARALQGVSAAIVWVSGLALLAASFSDDKAGAAIGMTSVGISAGELSGPIIGGLLYGRVGHFAVFAVAMSVVGLDVVLRLLMTQKSPAAVNDEQDRLIPDEEIPSFGTAGAQDDVSQNQCSEMNTRQSLVTKYTPKTNDTKVEANDTAKLTSIFWLLLRQPRFLASLWAEAVVAVFRTAFESTLVLLVSSHFQWNPTASGLAIFAFLAPNLLGPFVGSYTGRHGPRWLTALTFFGMTPLFIAIAFSTANTLAAKIIFIILLALLGSGQAVNMTSHMVAISMIVERSKREDPDIFGRIDVNGQAYALMNLAYAAGMLVGPVWADLFIERLSWRALCLSFATLSLVSGILVAFFSLHGEADNEENNS